MKKAKCAVLSDLFGLWSLNPIGSPRLSISLEAKHLWPRSINKQIQIKTVSCCSSSRPLGPGQSSLDVLWVWCCMYWDYLSGGENTALWSWELFVKRGQTQLGWVVSAQMLHKYWQLFSIIIHSVLVISKWENLKKLIICQF